jgi:hypothetical protein
MVAAITAVVLVTPVSLRLWLKSSHRNLSLPTRVYAQPLSQLEVVAPAGSVTIVPDSGRVVTVATSLSWDFAQPTVRQAVQGQTLRIAARCPGPDFFEDCQVGLTIHVPAHLAVVMVTAGSGSISVAGLTGSLHLAVTSGSITMTGVRGAVSANAGSGSITGSGVDSPDVETVLGSGSLQLGLRTVPDVLDVAIGSGSGSVTLPSGARMKVLANSGSGTLVIAPSIRDASAPGTLTATLGTGLLTIGHPRPPG